MTIYVHVPAGLPLEQLRLFWYVEGRQHAVDSGASELTRRQDTASLGHPRRLPQVSNAAWRHLNDSRVVALTSIQFTGERFQRWT